MISVTGFFTAVLTNAADTCAPHSTSALQSHNSPVIKSAKCAPHLIYGCQMGPLFLSQGPTCAAYSYPHHHRRGTACLPPFHPLHSTPHSYGKAHIHKLPRYLCSQMLPAQHAVNTPSLSQETGPTPSTDQPPTMTKNQPKTDEHDGTNLFLKKVLPKGTTTHSSGLYLNPGVKEISPGSQKIQECSGVHL